MSDDISSQPSVASTPAPAHLSAVEKEEQKEIIKEALKEWLDEKWATVGKWTAKGVAATALSALAYWWLTTHGWHH